MEALAAPHHWLDANLERIPAVDGSQLEWQSLVSKGLFAAEVVGETQTALRMQKATIGERPRDCSPHLTLGGCGCALSHQKAWQRFLESNKKLALIFEDDLVDICEDFDHEFQTVLRALPTDCQFCYIGFHTGELLPSGKHFSGDLLKVPSTVWLAGLWAYLITRTLAEKLLQLPPIQEQIDRVVGSLGSSGGWAYAVTPGEFLVFAHPTEVSQDTDVQTFLKDLR